jgi:hypothetical protein
MSEEDQSLKEVNVAPIGVLCGVTKTKSFNIKLTGEEFLEFHNTSGRIVFSKKLSERATDEALIKIGLRLLKEKVEARTKNGEQFISADSL